METTGIEPATFGLQSQAGTVQRTPPGESLRRQAFTPQRLTRSMVKAACGDSGPNSSRLAPITRERVSYRVSRFRPEMQAGGVEVDDRPASR